jgi:hypothetical protein
MSTEYVYDELAIEQAKQVLELNEALVILQKENMQLRESINEISTHVADLEQIPVPPSVIKQIMFMEANIRKLESDLEYYKSHVTKDVIINRVNMSKPVRTGGIPIKKKKIK